MSFVLLGILNSQAAGGGGLVYWASFIAEGLKKIDPKGMSNTYLQIGTTRNTDGITDTGSLIQYDAEGNILWQKYAENTTGDTRVFATYGVVFDGTNSIALLQDEQSGNSDLVLIKVSPSGALLAQTAEGLSGNYKSADSNLALDSNNYLISGGLSDGSPNVAHWTVWDNNFNKQYDTRFFDNSNFDNLYHTQYATDSSNNVFFAAQWNTGPTEVVIAKYSSSGTLLTAQRINASDDLPMPKIFLDSSDNFYVSYRDQNTSGWGAGIRRLTNNLGGSGGWQKTLFRSGWNHDRNMGIAQDANDNIIMAQSVTNDTGKRLLLVASLTQAGVLNWQQYITFKPNGSEQSLYGKDMRIDANGNIVLSADAYDNPNADWYSTSLVIPPNGSITGEFNVGTLAIEVSNGSHTLGTTSYGIGEAFAFISGSGFTEPRTPNIALTNSNFTQEITQIG